jgi:hypothetical protein
MRLQPEVLFDELSGLVLEQHGDVVFEGVHLDEAGDLDVADPPVPDVLSAHGIPLESSC